MSVVAKKRLNAILINGILGILCFLWTIPTVGLFISSFRTRFDISTSGWWSIMPHREWVPTGEIEDLPHDFDIKVPFAITSLSEEKHLFAEWREGIEVDGVQVQWIGNRRNGRVETQKQKWTMNTDFTLDNYSNVLTGKQYEIRLPDGSTKIEQGDNMTGAFLNSLAIAIPATVIPILIAAYAAYGFAWMNFFGRKPLFILVVALLVVPLQVALVPILKDYTTLNINGTFLAIWLAHTGFGLPLATYLLFNYISALPRETLESAFVDGASHSTVFWKLVLPLSTPALASFAIFQFLWVWNDYIVSLVFLGAKKETQVITMRLAEIVGSRGNDWHLLTSGAFITMLLPLIVFFSLQRYFVRGLLAGSVKG